MLLKGINFDAISQREHLRPNRLGTVDQLRARQGGNAMTKGLRRYVRLCGTESDRQTIYNKQPTATSLHRRDNHTCRRLIPYCHDSRAKTIAAGTN